MNLHVNASPIRLEYASLKYYYLYINFQVISPNVWAQAGDWIQVFICHCYWVNKDLHVVDKWAFLSLGPYSLQWIAFIVRKANHTLCLCSQYHTSQQLLRDSIVGPASFTYGYMMTSSNGNIFRRVTGPLCGELTGQRWFPLTKASDAELWRSSDLRLEKTVE